MVIQSGEDKELSIRRLSSYQYSAAGFGSGIATRALVQPLDVLKIRFQLQEEPFKGAHGKYYGLAQALTLIKQEEGLSAFWKGHVPAQYISAIYGLVQFSVFETLRLHLRENVSAKRFNRTNDFVCGAIAGSSGMVVSLPFDVLRTRLVAQGKDKIYRGMFHAIRSIWQSEGAPGFFRGIVPCLAQVAPNAGLQFSIYNQMTTLWKSISYMHNYGSLLCGILAGIAAKTMVYPLDLLRHRKQVTKLTRIGFGKTTPYSNTFRLIKGIIIEESMSSFLRASCPAC
uniref:Mitochondrial thiamine pyrophosphate carrier n=1 Tax=Ditylenchus dipsaci TaxID=166011 RepID=A0A915DEM1_9BILA